MIISNICTKLWLSSTYAFWFLYSYVIRWTTNWFESLFKFYFCPIYAKYLFTLFIVNLCRRVISSWILFVLLFVVFASCKGMLMYEWIRIVIGVMRIYRNIIQWRLMTAYGNIDITMHFDWWRGFIVCKCCYSSSHLNVRFLIGLLTCMWLVFLGLIAIDTYIIMMTYFALHIVSANVSLFLA